jgi:hypothetical protein
MSSTRIKLETWKQIAAYMDVSVRVAKRRAKRYGMPVIWVAGDWWAYADEIDAWLAKHTLTYAQYLERNRAGGDAESLTAPDGPPGAGQPAAA